MISRHNDSLSDMENGQLLPDNSRDTVSVNFQHMKKGEIVSDYLIADPNWNILLLITGAFHFPVFDIIKYPCVTAIQILAICGILLAVFTLIFDLYMHVTSPLYAHMGQTVAYIVGDIVVFLQTISLVLGIIYAVKRMKEPAGIAGDRTAAGQTACFDYALRKSRVFLVVAVVMFSFTGAIIAYNGQTAVTYHSFALSLATIVTTLVASNLLSLWMMVFIWVDTEASARVVNATIAAASDGTLTVSRYHRKIAQFKKRMASIGGLLDVVVIVAYINTIAFAFILLVCPPKIALSYVATFGRETVILLLMLPGIASVNDRHKELLNAVANTSKDEPSSDYASPAITASTSTSNFLAYNSNSQLNNNQQQVLRAWEHSTPSTPNSTIDRKENSNKKGDGNNATAAVGEWYVGQTASGSSASLDSRQCVPNPNATLQLQREVETLKLWMVINNFPLQIPILTNKIITKDNLRTQLMGSVLFIVSVAIKMGLERYAI